jgi:DNA polymerase-3 subunit epsilon/ATP-dependent DNA helicase DinG
VLAKVLVWLEAGGSGDRGEINLPGPGELAAWSRLSAESEDCSGDACLVHTGGACPYYKSRQAAEAAHVVIVNHALLLADIATGNRVIPDYRYLIVDEAHHLEDAVTNGLSFHVTQADTDRLLRDLVGPGGLLTSVLGAARSQLTPETSAQVAKGVALATDWVNDGSQLTQRFFDAISAFLTRARDDKELGPYGQQVRIVPATRTLPDWGAIEVAWEDLRQPLSKIVTTLDELAEALAGVGESEEGAAEDLALTLHSASRDLQEIFTNLENMVFEPEGQTIYWAEASIFQGRVSLHAAPLEVGPEKDSVIMTSATLTTGGEFDYIRRRLRADDADELALGSPFDYESSTLLFLVNDIPEPNERQEYQHAVERGLLRLCKATHGRTLALFTSYDQLRRTSKAISDPLAAEGILVFEQGEGASPHSLLESFRTTEQAVLLGTRSFWEGVDVPGEALSVLAIIRLPFDVPSDPIVAARSETYESPFAEYSLPEAILRFRQGFGRLIRTRSDRGVVATFDRRILSKQYGRAFVDSLPQCTVKVGPLADLPSAAARWLGA